MCSVSDILPLLKVLSLEYLEFSLEILNVFLPGTYLNTLWVIEICGNYLNASYFTIEEAFECL